MEFVMKRGFELIKAFVREEEGIALTEYLILLGLLIAGVIAAVTLAGQNLSAAWNSWATFFTQIGYP